MKENKDQPKKMSTCFEGSPTAEMMQKIMGERGIGSLSEEMMRSLIKKLNENIEESQNPNKEEI
jgi:hypothetical protein